MRHFFTMILLATAVATANATIHTVTCQNSPSHFLPVTVYAVIGDTIHWTWVAGDHITGPINTSYIPAGAAMWYASIDAGHLTFDYVVTVAGNYHYVCHPANPHGEDAFIVVSSPTGVQPYRVQSNFSDAYPNPFSEKITIETLHADLILVYNCMGEKIKSFPLQSGQTKLEADLAALPKGIFFYSIIKDGVLLETKKIIKG